MVDGKRILIIKEYTTGKLQVRRVKSITNNLALSCVGFNRPLIQTDRLGEDEDEIQAFSD